MSKFSRRRFIELSILGVGTTAGVITLPACSDEDNNKPDNKKPDNNEPDNNEPDNKKPDNNEPDNNKPDNKVNGPTELPHGELINFYIQPVLQGPKPDSMSIMFELENKADTAPKLWFRKFGSKTVFSEVEAVNAPGYLYDEKIYFIQLNKLKSNTLYEYAILTQENNQQLVSESYCFKTWPQKGDNVQKAAFITLADTQDGRLDVVENISKAIVNKVATKNDKTELIELCNNFVGLIIAGDLVGNGSKRWEWRDWLLEPLSPVLSYIPIIPIQGNHEYFDDERSLDDKKKWSLNHRKYFYKCFEFDSKDDQNYQGHWYYLDYLDLRIIALDITPATAMHNSDGWDAPEYDYGKGLFREDYTSVMMKWYEDVIAKTKADKKSHVFLIQHQPALSTKWRQGEAVVSADTVRMLERYSEDNDVITAHFSGHVHTYERGNSMNGRHLWITAASGSGALEPDIDRDHSYTDVFANVENSYGYGVVTAVFADKPALTWQRYSADRETRTFGVKKVDFSTLVDVRDEINITVNTFMVKPTLKAFEVPQKLDKIVLEFGAEIKDIYEAQWQFSQNSDFATGLVFDLWGQETRKNSWNYQAENEIVNIGAKRNIKTIKLGDMLSNPKPLYPFANNEKKELVKEIIPGANALLERWRPERKWDERQTYAQISQNGKKYSLHDPFREMLEVPTLRKTMQTNQTWFYRVRVRDKHLNWGSWSDAGSFDVA